MVTFNDTNENVAYLAALFGFEPITAKAWIRLEGQATPNPTNPLNIRNSLEMIGQTPSGFAYFETPFHGLLSARRIVERNSPAYGYDNILAAAWSRDPLRQARVIERSSWAAGNYGSDWPNNKPGNIYNYVKGNSVLEIDTAGINIQPGNMVTVVANTEILDGIGKVITKVTSDVTVPKIGVTEDGWHAILFGTNKVRFVRVSTSPATVDPCSDEVQVALASLNARIDAAQSTG